jgi:molybdate transport system ATP-binding protein
MRHNDIVFSLKNAVVGRNDTILINEFNWNVHSGESWLICGDNGSGKTTLLEILIGQQRLSGGKMILPNDISIEEFSSSVAFIKRDFSLYHLFGQSSSFYQQRFFSMGVEETPLVVDFIAAETKNSEEIIRSAAQEFRFDDLLNKHIVSLSTGEGRRVLLLILWLTDKKIIFFDDPFSGLDAEGKELVCHAFKMLSLRKVTILITGVTISSPDFIENVLYIKNQNIAYVGTTQNFEPYRKENEPLAGKIKIINLVQNSYSYSFKIAAEMKDITIRYNGKVIQKDFSWTINRGDKWMLTGSNGSGKSTLMSLIYGDNPMAYAYELVIFDRIRGTGETIWDVKRPIGYFSSELQQFFPRSLTLYEAVLTGYSDHLVVRSDLTREHYLQADELIKAAGIANSRNIPLSRLPFSKCRLALVCRALVKMPPVIILDEPCQGLDKSTTEIVNCLVDAVCEGESKTLIYVTHQTNDVPKIVNLHLQLKK